MDALRKRNEERAMKREERRKRRDEMRRKYKIKWEAREPDKIQVLQVPLTNRLVIFEKR